MRRRTVRGMRGCLLGAAGLLLAASAARPGLAQSDWNQAYGTIGNSSFVEVDTHIGVAPRWSVELPGPVKWGGPAIGDGDSIYVATTNGIVVGVFPSGKLRCSASFPGAIFTSTPATLPNGQVAILFQRFAGPGMQGFLAMISADCKVMWEVELPRWTPERNSVSSGSVKVWSFPGIPPDPSFLFVHGRGTRQADITGPGLLTWNDLLVYTADGQLFARHPVGETCVDVGGGGGTDLGDVWDWITGLVTIDHTIPPLYEQFGWPDSTPAIMDSLIRGFSSWSRPLVAVTDPSCYPRMDIFMFRPAATTAEERLVKTWSKKIADRGVRVSSPAVTREGQVAIGTSAHR